MFYNTLQGYISTGIFYIFALTLVIPGVPLRAQSLPEVQDLPVQESLPDPFVMMDGSRVKTVDDWYNKRRPELKILFQHYMYGYLPLRPEMKVTINKKVDTLFSGKATYKEITLELLLPENKIQRINLALFVPNDRNGPAPVFISGNKCGNHTIIDSDVISIFMDAWKAPVCGGRGSKKDIWELGNTISRGYALATFHVSDMDPDKWKEEDFDDGIHGSYPSAPGDQDTRWGSLAAWAWGIHRVVDYLETDEKIDNSRICITGWSRRGKTALFAAAMDERIDLVVPHQSGTGGTAISRGNTVQSVANINTNFPAWFNNNFVKFNNNENRLPFDQHLLVALCAPRPLMDGCGLQDQFVSPDEALRSLKAASPVYEFLGVKGIVGKGNVLEKDLKKTEMGRLLQYRRDTPHILNIDYWNAMLDFADVQLKEVLVK